MRWIFLSATPACPLRKVISPPFVFRVASCELGFDGGVVDGPEAGEVVGDLDGAIIGGEDIKEDGDGAVADGDGALEVVEFLFCKVCSNIERLVTDEHTIAEAVRCERFWGRESAATEEVSFAINQVRVSIENGRMAVTSLSPLS